MPAILPLTKPAIRKQLLVLREQLAPELRAAYSEAISARIIQHAAYRQAATILGYMSFGTEFDSDAWIRQVLAEGKKLALPRVNPHANRLDLYWVEDPEYQIEPGMWGIREPAVERCKRLTTLNEVEFALLPGVAFSRYGARLGYGGGFYDKLLAGMLHRPVLAAAAYALQIVEYIPQETTDVKIDWLFTEQEEIACPG